MSSHTKKVMSLEDKIDIIRKFEALNNRKEMDAFIKHNSVVLVNKEKILAQYDDMKAKLAAVNDLVITGYGKPNYVSEKHALLQKIMVVWYRRAIKKYRRVTLALLGHNTNFAMGILNITGLPMSESQIFALKRNCHQASLQRDSKIDGSSTLCLRKIAQEMLKEMGISKAAALSVYGPNIFEERRDDMPSDAGTSLGKRKFKQKERSSSKSSRTSNGKHELNRSDVVQSEESEEETHPNDCIWPYDEVKVEEDDENEEEDFELYDVVSVVDSTEEIDAATSAGCTIDSEKEAEVVPASIVIKSEPNEGQPAEDCSTEKRITITDVREGVEGWLIKKECEPTEDEEALGPIPIIKIESDSLALCDGMSTCFEDCVKEETGEAHSDLDKKGLGQLLTATSEDRTDGDSATENGRCVDTDQDAMRTLKLIKGYLQKQNNRRALEALAKVEAAFPRSARGSD